jgi:Cupin superfamily protein
MAEVTPATFERLLAPISVPQFFAEYFERAPLRLAGRDPAIDGLTVDRLHELIETRRYKYDEVFVIDARRKIPSGDYATSDGFTDPARLYQQYEKGATIVMRDFEAHEITLAELCRSAELIYECPFRANVYITPPNASCFPRHHDCSDVFALQLVGSKLWQVSPPQIELPLADQASYTALEADGEGEDFRLEAGDLLYCPRGFAHFVQSESRPSVHVSLASFPYTWADVLTRAVRLACRQDPRFRASLPRGFASGEVPMAALQEKFAELVRLHAAGARCAPAVDNIREEFMRGNRPLLSQINRHRRLAARRSPGKG